MVNNDHLVLNDHEIVMRDRSTLAASDRSKKADEFCLFWRANVDDVSTPEGSIPSVRAVAVSLYVWWRH